MFSLTGNFSILPQGNTFSLFTHFDILVSIFLFPIFTFFILRAASGRKKAFQYKIALYSSAISFLLSLLLWWGLSRTKGGFQEVFQYTYVPSFSFALRFGVDGISLFFILLTNFFIFLCIFSLNSTTFRQEEAIRHLIFLQWSIIASFLFIDLLGFFVFFERTLVPIYFLVLIWGSRERRVRASYRISIYTLLGSVFRFFNILYLYSKTGTTDYELLLQILLTETDQRFLWITFFLAFAAKIPLFPFHIWLPEAHVEAPTIGSVLLAVLLLKMGTYGLVRFSLPLFPEGTIYFGPFVSTFALLGIIYTCLTAIRQVDLKKIIAYSSVGHRNVILLGIRAGTSEALQGALFQRLSHGIVSGALFFCVGVLYERYTVRSFKYYGGLAHFYPLFTRVFLVFSLANIGFPLTSSFVGEFVIFLGLFREHFWATFFAAFSRVLGAVYTLWTFNRMFFGNIRVYSIVAYRDLQRKEAILFGYIIVVLFVRGIASSLFLDVFLVDVMNILEHSALITRLLVLTIYIFSFFYIYVYTRSLNYLMNNTFSSFSISKSFFTFRELRKFRSLYFSRHLFLKNEKRISVSLYGNAESISPIQRRLFRESINKAGTSQDGHSLSSFDSLTISIFPKKRAATIYAFSSFAGIRSFFKGNILQINIKNKISPNLRQQNVPLVVSAYSYELLQKGQQEIQTYEQFFSFLPIFIEFKNFFFTRSSVVRSYFSWRNFFNKKKFESIQDIPFQHLIRFLFQKLRPNRIKG